MRIYEISKQLGVSNKEILELLHKKGFVGQSHMAALSEDLVNYIYSHYKKQPSGPEVQAEQQQKESKKEIISKPEKTEKNEKPRVSPQKSPEPTLSQPENSLSIPQAIVQEAPKTEAPQQTLILKPMSVGEFAGNINKPVHEVILHLLKQNMAFTINQLLPIKVVEQLSKFYDIKTVPVGLRSEGSKKLPSKPTGQLRMPIIVVIGHVDHGKTTLLDYIRKTKVAAKEKGGITQHLGAYQVNTTHGGIVFLDTPGHEAFSKMRARGIRLADIAILVIAADDGVMPQTIEAIKHAQVAEIPIIVAINKIDKVPAVQIEKVKQGLTKHGLLPEEWGGQIICVPISAKQGTGVDQLLEMVALQAELMELKAEQSCPAKGFVLEANMEKGRGAVATVILHQGILHIGDYFVAGIAYGKVNSMMDSYGALLKEVGPSVPVKVAGWEKLAEAGDLFEVVLQDAYRKARSEKNIIEKESKHLAAENAINVIIKTDNKSSCEALLDAIKRLETTGNKQLNIIHSAIGDITESDISLASNTHAIIYGFHVKLESKAGLFAHQEGITIKLFDIIYRLLEDLQILITAKVEPKKEKIKIGQAEVRKIFSIKGLGVIAGSYVKEGRITRNADVEIYRDNHKIGQGPIKSLERDRKAVKEVHKGFECAFLVDNFNDWQEGDRVDFFIYKAAEPV